MADDLGRRDLIKLTAAVVVAGKSVFAEEGAPLFFTKDEFAVVDEASDIIIPTDDHSPGARAAGCAAFIDKMLAQSQQDEEKKHWRDGVKLIDALSVVMNSAPFMKATPEQRTQVIERMSEHERKSFVRHNLVAPGDEPHATPAELFFLELKTATVHAYFTSEIGIHKEMEYKGNVMLNEFVGIALKD